MINHINKSNSQQDCQGSNQGPRLEGDRTTKERKGGGEDSGMVGRLPGHLTDQPTDSYPRIQRISEDDRVTW